MSYRPESLVLTLSRRCNINCSHCIVDANPKEDQTLDPSLLDPLLAQAKDNGIKDVVIYGGETFLHIKDLLPHTLHKVFSYGFDVSMATNGFWGRNDTQSQQYLEIIDNIAKQFSQSLYLALSVDEYHQPQVPVESLANIIKNFRLGDFSNTSLHLCTFQGERSQQVVTDLFNACHNKGVYLMEFNHSHDCYPALPEELIEMIPQNYPLIAKELGLLKDATENDIYTTLVWLTSRLKLDTVIARKFDVGYGERKYLIFPDKRYLMTATAETRPLYAGRAKNGRDLEVNLYGESREYLVIAPTGEAYRYPANITAASGIPAKNRPFEQIVGEVGITFPIPSANYIKY